MQQIGKGKIYYKENDAATRSRESSSSEPELCRKHIVVFLEVVKATGCILWHFLNISFNYLLLRKWGSSSLTTSSSHYGSNYVWARRANKMEAQHEVFFFLISPGSSINIGTGTDSFSWGVNIYELWEEAGAGFNLLWCCCNLHANGIKLNYI